MKSTNEKIVQFDKRLQNIITMITEYFFFNHVEYIFYWIRRTRTVNIIKNAFHKLQLSNISSFFVFWT